MSENILKILYASEEEKVTIEDDGSIQITNIALEGGLINKEEHKNQ